MSSDDRQHFLQLEEEASRLRHEKAELLARLRLERAKAEIYERVTDLLGTTHDPADVAALLLRVVTKALNIETGWVLVRSDATAAGGMRSRPYDRDAESIRLTCLAAAGPHRQTLQGLTLDPQEGVAAWVAAQSASQVVDDPVKDPRFTAELGRKLGFEVHCILAVPIRAGGEPVGAVELFNKADGRFTPSDVELASAAADRLAGLLENARLLQQATQRADQMSTLAAALAQLNATPEPDQVFALILETAPRITSARAAALLLPGQPVRESNLDQALGEDAEAAAPLWRNLRDELAAWVSEHRETICIEDLRSDSRWSSDPSVSAEFPIRSLVLVPIAADGTVLGVLVVANRQAADRFTPEDVRALETLASGAAHALSRPATQAQPAAPPPDASEEADLPEEPVEEEQEPSE